jgi:pimeloyl-ACP methyl ester carboxylesterase
MSHRWVILPGLAETPEEFGRVVDLLPDCDVRLVDPWSTPVTSPPAELRKATGVSGADRIGLVGHSIGGLAALRWTLTHPDEVDRLVLLDTSLTSESGWRWLYPGTTGNRLVRSVLKFLGRIGLPQLLGTTARRLFVRIGSMTNRDLLSKATARSRYGAADSWLLFWDELAASWHLAREVGNLLDRADLLLRDGALPPTILLVATGGSSRFTATRWLTAQQALATRLGATTQVLPDSAHLVHLDHPHTIAQAITQTP